MDKDKEQHSEAGREPSHLFEQGASNDVDEAYGREESLVDASDVSHLEETFEAGTSVFENPVELPVNQDVQDVYDLEDQVEPEATAESTVRSKAGVLAQTTKFSSSFYEKVRPKSITQKVGGAFAASFAVLLVLGTVSIIRLSSMEGEVKTLANHDMAVVNEASAVQSDLLRMENGLRGYLITGNQTLLTEYFQPSIQAYKTDEANLQQLLKSDAGSTAYLNQATPSVSKWIDYANQLVTMRNGTQGEEANSREASGEGDQMIQTATTALNKLVQSNQTHASFSATSLASSVTMTLWMVIVLGILATLVILFFGIPASLSTPRNLRKVIRILNDIASAGGDLTRRIEGVTSRDEVQELAESTNRLLGTVGNLVKHVVETSESVAASAQQLTASTDETARAVSSIAETASEFSGISEQATASLGQMSHSVTNVKTQGDVVMERVQVVSTAVDEVVSSTEVGSRLVTDQQSSMERVQEIAQTTHQQIQALADSSRRIAKISNTIRSIADQTNLLALNAAIEAARAGEAGRGFAVVAQEVRKLAEQSGNATREIELIIKENQSLTVAAASSMEDGVQAVTEGAKMSQETSLAFAAIRESVNQVVPVARDIVANVMEQSARTEETLVQIRQVSDAMEQVAAGSEENAASTQECLATVEEISASSQALAVLAQKLQEMVGQFKI